MPNPALHAVNWLYAAFKSLSPYVLIYLSAQIIGELTGTRTRTGSRCSPLPPWPRRRCCRSSPPRSSAADGFVRQQLYINQKIYANKLLDMDFPSWTIPNARRSPRSSRTKNGSGYGLGRVLDVETKLPMSVLVFWALSPSP